MRSPRPQSQESRLTKILAKSPSFDVALVPHAASQSSYHRPKRARPQTAMNLVDVHYHDARHSHEESSSSIRCGIARGLMWHHQTCHIARWWETQLLP